MLLGENALKRELVSNEIKFVQSFCCYFSQCYNLWRLSEHPEESLRFEHQDIRQPGKVRTVDWSIYEMTTGPIVLNVVYLLMINNDSTEHVSAGE